MSCQLESIALDMRPSLPMQKLVLLVLAMGVPLTEMPQVCSLDAQTVTSILLGLMRDRVICFDEADLWFRDRQRWVSFQGYSRPILP